MEDEAETSKTHSGFFAVDRRQWQRVCGGGRNAAVIYLILCRGTGRDQRRSTWSVRSIETRTGISRDKARLAVSSLIADGFIDQERGGRLPVYRIQPFENNETEPEWIWLPNALVDGAASEVSPVELLRQAGNIDPLKLLIALYDVHTLANDGGIEWRPSTGIGRRYYSERLSEYGQYAIWAFTPSDKIAVGDGFKPLRLFDGNAAEAAVSFMNAFTCLISLGLVFEVEHIVENDSDEAEVLHPAPTESGTLEEIDLGKAAHAAALAALPAWRWETPDFSESEPYVPIRRHMTNAEMIGIFRLLYIPHTAATKEWHERRHHWLTLKEKFEALQNAVKSQKSAVKV